LQGAEAVAHEIQSRKEAALPVLMDVSGEKSVESAFESVRVPREKTQLQEKLSHPDRRLSTHMSEAK
jgi:hypothetical protein